MRHSLLLLIFCFSFLVSHGETKFDFYFSKGRFRDTAVKTKLPFGSPILIKHKFPRRWTYVGDQDDSDHPSGPHQAASYKLTFFYNHLNALKATLLLKPTTIKNIPIGDDSLITEDKGEFIPKVAYQLPDFGPYKCYYQYDHQNHEGLRSKDRKSYEEIGNLILYGQKTGRANIFKVYTSYTYDDSFEEHNRFFYISENKIISIYHCWIGETEGYMKKAQTITVTSAGKIIIKNLK